MKNLNIKHFVRVNYENKTRLTFEFNSLFYHLHVKFSGQPNVQLCR